MLYVYKFLLIAILMLNACNIQPLYSKKNELSAGIKLQKLDINPVAGKEGYLLREKLIKLMKIDEKSPPIYVADIIYSKNSYGAAFQSNGVTTRVNNTFSASFTLKNISTGKLICAGTANILNGYDAMTSIYAESVAADKSIDNGLDMLAGLLHVKFAGCV